MSYDTWINQNFNLNYLKHMNQKNTSRKSWFTSCNTELRTV